MFKFLNFNHKNSLKKLESILNVRKSRQQNQSATVKKILYNVKKNGDEAVIMYEKKFSNIKNKSKKLQFSKNEINSISKTIDKKLKKSIDTAFTIIKYFHSKQTYSAFKYRYKYKN